LGTSLAAKSRLGEATQAIKSASSARFCDDLSTVFRRATFKNSAIISPRFEQLAALVVYFPAVSGEKKDWPVSSESLVGSAES
jgi:hypothetical protein